MIKKQKIGDWDVCIAKFDDLFPQANEIDRLQSIIKAQENTIEELQKTIKDMAKRKHNV